MAMEALKVSYLKRAILSCGVTACAALAVLGAILASGSFVGTLSFLYAKNTTDMSMADGRPSPIYRFDPRADQLIRVFFPSMIKPQQVLRAYVLRKKGLKFKTPDQVLRDYNFQTRLAPGYDTRLDVGDDNMESFWLVSGTLPSAARRAAIVCFAVFGTYVLYEALAGKADCGCFGQVHVNPWYTFVLDAAIVLALAYLAKPARDTEKWSRPSKHKWPVLAAASGIGLAGGIGAAILHPKPAASPNGLFSADGGKIVILEPQKWIRRQLPVLTHIMTTKSDKPLAGKLAHGQWAMLFYHANCHQCQRAIPVYERAAAQWEAKGNPLRMVFIRVPSDLDVVAPKGLFHSDAPIHGTLDASHEWFATTPAVVELRNGMVNRAATDMAAMNLKWMK